MQQKQISGIFYAAFASLWWGVIGTIFFKFVSFASFIELTVHRTIWTAVLPILIFKKINLIFFLKLMYKDEKKRTKND